MGVERSQELDDQVGKASRAEGITFTFARMERTPNTLDAHRLIWLAEREQCQDAVVEGLFRAHFTEGRDIGDRETLLAVVAKVGLSVPILPASRPRMNIAGGTG